MPGIREISQAKGRDSRKNTSANTGTEHTGGKDSRPTPHQRKIRYQSWWIR